MKRMNVRWNSILIIVCIVLLYISILSDNNIVCRLMDDIVPLYFGILWVRELPTLSKKNTAEIKVFLLLVLITILGLVSNLISGLAYSWTNILIDLFSFWKLYLVYMGTNAFMKVHKEILQYTICILGKLSKGFICFSFIFGLLNLVGIVSMAEEMERYGYYPYRFIFKNASQFGVLLGISLAFILYNRSKKHLIYEILSVFTMMLTLKGMSLIIVVVYVLLRILHAKRIRIWQLCALGFSLGFTLRYQIYRYLLDETAPRAMLLKYGLVTAFRYFPFGSGFSTYGSDIAGRYYSPLYVLYGFSERKSLQYLSVTALNDVYLGMAFGQFGFLGAIALLGILAIIGLPLLKLKTRDKSSMYITIALFACMCGMAVMAGSIKVAPGQLMMFAISVFISKTYFENATYKGEV
ncbi:MAG: hypothetical protein HFI13_12785 [Lachnospiraceae bacterium]|nr:hypothetical protein [Lachnospiraceae bacterium]